MPVRGACRDSHRASPGWSNSKGKAHMWKTSLDYLRPKLVGILAVLLLATLSGAAPTGVVPDPEMFSQHLITATTLASAQLESLKTLGYRHLAFESNTTTEAYHSIAEFPTYRRQTTVEVDTPDRGMKQVTVTVYWDGDVNAVRMSLILAE